MASGEMDQAARVFAKMAASPQAYVGLAETDLATNHFAAASENARRALELAPNSIQAQRVSALAAMGLGRPQDALLVARDMQTQWPRESLGYVLEGEIESTSSTQPRRQRPSARPCRLPTRNKRRNDCTTRCCDPDMAPGLQSSPTTGCGRIRKTRCFCSTWPMQPSHKATSPRLNNGIEPCSSCSPTMRSH